MITKLLTPGFIGGAALKNRVVFPSMCNFYCDEQGFVTEQLKEYVKARAAGGAAMIIMPGSPHGEPGPARPALSDPNYYDGWKELAAICHDFDCRLFVQIHPAKAQAGRDPKLLLPDHMDRATIRSLIESYTRCACAAKLIGLDGVELHGAHAHEIAQFLSPFYNHRTDLYGNDCEGRSRFYREIIASIKKECGPDFPVICRISSSEQIPGGRTVEETARIAPLLEAAGADAIHVSIGMPLSEHLISAPMDVEDAFNLNEIARIKQAVHIPVIAVDRINTPELAEEILSSGKADFTAIGRGLLADPDFVSKITTGEPLIRCLGCNQGCRKSITKKAIFCVQNPQTGREASLHFTQNSSLAQKKILIAGAGPAGLEAARVLALRGAAPEIWEKKSRAGGLINLAKLPPHKEAMERIITFREELLKRMGITIHYEKEATATTVRAFAPDLILLATGSEPSIPPIEGLYADSASHGLSDHIYSADQFLSDPALQDELVQDGRPVAVLGGGLIGTETAELLCSLGLPVTVLEMGAEIAKELNKNRKHYVMERLAQGNADLLVNTKVISVHLPEITVQSEGRISHLTGYSAVITALGRTNRNSKRLEKELSAAFPQLPIIPLGDAQTPSMAMDAIATAARIAADL